MYISLSELVKRGWRRGAVEALLGAPDRIAPNPHYRAGSPMRFYLTSRVAAIEATPQFTTMGRKSARRVASATRVAERKRNELAAYITALEIRIPEISMNELFERACDHYNDFWESRGRDDKWATSHQSEEFLKRLAVNFLRHEMSVYEEELGRMFGKIGRAQGSVLLKAKVLAAIGVAYPALAGEAQRQIIG